MPALQPLDVRREEVVADDLEAVAEPRGEAAHPSQSSSASGSSTDAMG